MTHHNKSHLTPHFNRQALSHAIWLGLGLIAAPALAQQAATATTAATASSEATKAEAASAQKTDKTKADEIEVIEVSGFRGSLNVALAAKREAVGSKETILAEDLGKFPDLNIADSLARRLCENC